MPTSITYNPQTYTITAPDTQPFAIDTVFFMLLRNEPIEEDTIEHIVARFYTSMKYVPVYIPDREATYKVVTHLVVTNNQATFVQPDTFHQSLIAYLTGAGYNVTVQSS